MNRALARQLSRLTGEFYRQVGASFSKTRAAGWPGWERVLACIAPSTGGSPRVLDLACGNLRFERALFERYPQARSHAVDAADEMVGVDDERISYQHLDLAELLLEPEALVSALDAPPCDAAVCLAFMHHLPLPVQRVRLLETLVRKVRPGGIVAVSFWQFAHDGRLLGKARHATAAACSRYGLPALGPDDYLMGWQDEEDAFRFCHHASDSEIDALLETVASRTRMRARYRADGASGELNQYVILEVR